MHRLPKTLASATSPARSIPSYSPLTITSRLQPRSPFNHKPQIQPCYRFSHTSLVSNINTNPPFRRSSSPPPPQPPTADPEVEIPANEGEYYSPYQPKRQWPPDMSKLSPKHQFRLERKYRRRAALKYARPKWNKATTLVQWGAIGFVLLYALLFMEWDEKGGGSLIEDLRAYIFGAFKGAFSAPPPPTSMRRSEESARG